MATVEFTDRVRELLHFTAKILTFHQDSVPSALTKDKKRLFDQEISVHLAWKSTLYVANFPESADDSYIRNLLEKARFHYSTCYVLTLVTSLGPYLMFVGPVKNSKTRVGSAMFSSLHQCVSWTRIVHAILTPVVRMQQTGHCRCTDMS